MEHNLTAGKISKSLIIFSLPMIFGNLIQQLYNIVDTLIVGKLIGPNALSAVGSSYTLIILLTSIILGLCMGSGVVFAQFYGAKKIDSMKKSIFNAFIFIFCFSLFINIISFLLIDKFIIWLNIPSESMKMTSDYLKIILLGMTFVTIYNFIASIFRSVGNTFIPLIFLALSSVINIILDIIFIMNFNMGVSGAALATVISQALSAFCIIIYFFMYGRNFCPNKNHLHFNSTIMRKVIDNSALTAIQQSIMNFGILMIQSLVNSFGFSASAAFAVVVKIDAFAYMPSQDFGNAFSTFVAQNYGAKLFSRIKKGTLVAFKISSIFSIIASIIVVVFAKEFILIFVNIEETQIIKLGVNYLYIVGTSYIGIGILFLFYGLYRGLGKSQISIVLTVISLGSRVALAYLLSSNSYIGISGIWYAIPIGWLLADLFGGFYFIFKFKKALF